MGYRTKVTTGGVVAAVALAGVIVLPVSAAETSAGLRSAGGKASISAPSRAGCRTAKQKAVCKQRRQRPGAPKLKVTNPASPADDTTPRVLGSARAGTLIRIYSDTACTKQVAAGTAAQLAGPGIVVPVSPDSTTRLRATARVRKGKTSACPAGALTYVEAAVKIGLVPELFPAFDRQVSDYVTRCDGSTPVSLDVRAPNASLVSVDGLEPRNGNFSTEVALDHGQRFSFWVADSAGASVHHVRCLPPDFPVWTFERFSRPDSEFYVVTPNIGLAMPNLVAVYDEHGVPAWWFESDDQPIDGKVLSDGSIAWARAIDLLGYEIRSLDGTLTRTVQVVGGPQTDLHDLQETGDGNLLLIEYSPRFDVDTTGCGLEGDAFVLDGVIQEVDPQGNLVWEWDSGEPGQVAPSETGRWCDQFTTQPYDLVHLNSVEVDGDAILVSARHTDAVYKISRTTGDIIWKLGGTTTPESLTVLDDPFAAYPFGGQHDARVLPDGTVTVHDNGTQLPDHPPRAVRYEIDENASTARLIESVTDPEAPGSFCCGSSRRAGSGAWLMSWGGNRFVTEFAPDGDRAFMLRFPDAFTYRAVPVNPDLVSRADLRAGMDSMFPRP